MKLKVSIQYSAMKRGVACWFVKFPNEGNICVEYLFEKPDFNSELKYVRV